MSMSSELQAIMQRRLAKSNLNQGQQQEQEKQTVVGNSNDDNVAKVTKPSVVTKEGKEKSPNSAPSRFKFTSKKSPVIESKREEKSGSPVSDFQRNIALFNQITPKNSNPSGYVGYNSLKSPVAAKADSPVPFDEKPKVHFSVSKASNKKTQNDLLKRNYSHQTSPNAASIGLWNNNKNQNRSNVDTNKEKHEVAKQQTVAGTAVPKFVVTQRSPPPPPPPYKQGLEAEGTKTETTSSAIDLSSQDSDQKSLSLSHVQAMKLKFLLKNPEPRPISPSSLVMNPKSKFKSPSENVKEIKVEKPVTNLKPIIQDDFKDATNTGASSSSSSGEEKTEGEVMTDGKDRDEIKKAFDQFSPFREIKVDAKGTRFDDDNISIDGTSKSEANGDFEQKESLFAPFDNLKATSKGNAEFSDAGVDWGWNQDFFSGDVDLKGGWDKELITSDHPSKDVGIDMDDVYMPPPSYDFGPTSMFDNPKEDPFEDDDDEETLMGGDMHNEAANDIVIRSFDLLRFNHQNSTSCLSSHNPITGNLIMCSIRNKRWYIDEVEVSSKIKVVSTMEISCSQISKKMEVKGIIPCGIKNVLSLSGGVQLSNKGREVYVVVLISLYVLGSPGTVEVFAVWNWDYTCDGKTDIPDAIISAPTVDYEYEPDSLISADGLIFICATIRRKPVVLVSKPSSCSKWVSYFTDDENSHSQSIIMMDVCPEGKLMALVFSDGVAYIWSYAEVVGLHPRFSTTNQMKLLYFLEDLSAFHPTSHEERLSLAKSCKSLQWLPSVRRLPSSNSTTSVYILAASFLTGVAIYAIPSQKMNGTVTSELSANPEVDIPQSKPGESMAIHPMAFTCALFEEIEDLHDSLTLKWIYVGEGLFPLLATILLRKERVFTHIGSLELPLERAARETELITINTVAMGDFSSHPNTTIKFHVCSFAGSFIAHSPGRLTAFCMTSRQSISGSPAMHPNISIKSLPISSDAMGVTSDGSVLQSFSDFFHIHRTYHFDITVHRKSPTTSTQYIKIFPYQRNWFCRSTTGDGTSEVSRGSGDEFPKGGANTTILFDLDTKLSSAALLVPRRITRDKNGNYCLILFKDGSSAPSVRTSDTTIAFGLMEVPTGDKAGVEQIVVRDGKDACFLSLEKNIESHIITLDSSAKSLRIFSILSHKSELGDNETVIQIFKQGSSNDVNLVVERIMVASDKVLLLCSRKADGKQCLFLGGTIESLARNDFDILVRKKTRKLWLNNGESFLSMIQLPADNHDIPANVAISTTTRVMILSLRSQLHVLSQCSASITCGNLSQIGSHTIAFLETCDAGQRLSYLSTCNDDLVGVISSMSSGYGHSSLLVAVRPDRLLYLTPQHITSVSGSNNVDSISVPLILTRPLLLLEPLVTNAFMQLRSTDEKCLLLQTIFEKFGPKKFSNPHQDNEGIGTFGVGITPKVCSLVGSSLNELLKESEDGKEIAYWVPRLNERLPDLHSDLSFSLGEFDDTRHVWYLGPNGNRTELLLLDSFEEWLGKQRPSIIGEVGAEIAAETGERTLINILAAAKDVTVGNSHAANESGIENLDKQGWVRFVGEGRKDEDNLSLYIRFSEGSDDSWREKGIRDLSKYENKIVLLKQQYLDIQPTTSNVDEGEAGKVHPLYDLVFNEGLSENDGPGIIIEVPRGSSLDVGMLHSSSHRSRQRATLEFWFFVPRIPSEVILVRRSLLNEQNDNQTHCNHDLLWELVATPAGYLEFRTKSGTAFNSEYVTNSSTDNSDFDRTDIQDEKGKISFPKETGYGGWNHVTLSFSSQEINGCNVTLRMQGSFVASANVTFQLNGLDDTASKEPIDDLIKDSLLVFGQGAVKGMRFTEIRFWACKRASEDIKMMMYEYLDVAKSKKKFKVSIRNKTSNRSQKSSLLIPPRSSDRSKLNTFDRPVLQLPGSARRARNDEEESQGFENETVTSFADFGSVVSTDEVQVGDETVNNPYISEYLGRNSNDDDKNQLGVPSDELYEKDKSIFSPLSITELPLISGEIRRSAAAALIRGPPASRHFGGNRGGLHCSSESCAVGNICITGSEKTVIFSPCQVPFGRTYPIGASGAIISDNFDGTEYLCCFLAKDKRIVVFDLMNKVVVVELQMTTKLNYWRFLPPQTHGNTLVFLLVTPLGGFHWMPLEDSPRPKQIWRRGRDLQGKKILNYEEGGSNGLLGSESRSVLALVLASSKGPDDPAEAWCVSVEGGLKPLCISTNVCGAALFNYGVLRAGPFIPFIVTICPKDGYSNEAILRVNRICIDKESETMSLQDTVVVEETIMYDRADEITVPTMAMGSAPAALCLTCERFIIAIFRSMGYLLIYSFIDDKLTLVDKYKFGRYVVDAAIRRVSTTDGVEIVLLICEGEDMPDGRIVTVNFK